MRGFELPSVVTSPGLSAGFPIFQLNQNDHLVRPSITAVHRLVSMVCLPGFWCHSPSSVQKCSVSVTQRNRVQAQKILPTEKHLF